MFSLKNIYIYSFFLILEVNHVYLQNIKKCKQENKIHELSQHTEIPTVNIIFVAIFSQASAHTHDVYIYTYMYIYMCVYVL